MEALEYESAVNVYASLMGARHIMIDRGRQTVPTSGTAVRSDPLAAFAFLEPVVRAGNRSSCVVSEPPGR